jgi:3-hydroxyacyl-[acyl-carrier-protein] dehydratase
VTGAPARVGVAAPLRAVDTFTAVHDGDGWHLTAMLLVRGDDPNLRGHFPGLPVLPGVFVVEALGQLMRLALGDGSGAPALRILRSVRFFAPLVDGDELHLSARVTPVPGGWAVRAEGRTATGTVTSRIRAEFGQVC